MVDFRTMPAGTELNRYVSEIIFDGEDVTGVRDACLVDYSFHIAHAFYVINKMLAIGFDYDMYSVVGNNHHVRFTWLNDFEPSINKGVGEVSDSGKGDWYWGVTDKSLPRAICVAALVAITGNKRLPEPMLSIMQKKHQEIKE
jgi:hypothetical protein